MSNTLEMDLNLFRNNNQEADKTDPDYDDARKILETAGLRRKSRMLALQALFEVDCVNHKIEIVLNNLKLQWNIENNAMKYASKLAEGVIYRKKELDDILQIFAPNWPIEQISIIDRNILRLAIFEILMNNNVPAKSAINEAIELAKLFGSENSPKFINGVLGSVLTHFKNKNEDFCRREVKD